MAKIGEDEFERLKSLAIRDRILGAVSDFYISDDGLLVPVYDETYLGSRIIIPSLAMALSFYSFSDNTTVTSVKLGERVKILYSGCFRMKENLIEVIFNDMVETIGSFAFSFTGVVRLELPNSVKCIDTEAFGYAKNLEYIKLPRLLNKLGHTAFGKCSGLQAIELPENLIEIGNSMFHSCVSLKEIIIHSGCLSIDKAAFFDCSSLEKVTIEEGCTIICDEAFAGCSAIRFMKLPSSLKDVSVIAAVDASDYAVRKLLDAKA